jgi:hypothetical protein
MRDGRANVGVTQDLVSVSTTPIVAEQDHTEGRPQANESVFSSIYITQNVLWYAAALVASEIPLLIADNCTILAASLVNAWVM